MGAELEPHRGRDHSRMPGGRYQNLKAGFVPTLDSPGAEPWAGSIPARKDDGRGHLGLGLGGPRDWGGARASAAQPRSGIRACGAHSAAAGAYCHSREHEGPNPGAPHGESDPRALLAPRPTILHSAPADHRCVPKGSEVALQA